jgi:hypothetical protein|nr:MAG TPA: hypothetical protein [Caudoviricetes sp.]
MSEFQQFYEAIEELDLLTKEGFFGESAKKLIEKRDNMKITDFLYECSVDTFSNPHSNYGIKNIIDIMFMLLELYIEAIKATSTETVDNILAAFLKGTKEHPELECISSYIEYSSYHVEFKNLSSKLTKQTSTTVSEKRRLANSILSSYSKGVEFIGKSFAYLLALEEVIHNQPCDLYKNLSLTTYQKTNKFLKLSDGKYKMLTTVIDRDIRNADSHLNAHYSVKEQCYIIKKNKNSRMRIYKLPLEKMLFEVYPKIGWFVQGYLNACALLVLAGQDKRLYKQILQLISEVYSNPNIR